MKGFFSKIWGRNADNFGGEFFLGGEGEAMEKQGRKKSPENFAEEFAQTVASNFLPKVARPK